MFLDISDFENGQELKNINQEKPNVKLTLCSLKGKEILFFVKKTILDVNEDDLKRENKFHNINHENIVRVYYVKQFPKNKSLTIYMEYLKAGTLKELISFKKTLSSENTIKQIQWEKICQYICHEILKSLYYLQKQHHIHHRDIKPSNIGLSYQGGVKLLDFGTTIQNLASYCRNETMIGTMLYMPLEAFTEDNYRSDKFDVFSLGITIYQLLYGQHPFFSQEQILEGVDIEGKYSEYMMENYYLEISKNKKDKFAQILSQMLMINYKKRPKISQLLGKSIFQSQNVSEGKNMLIKILELKRNVNKTKQLIQRIIQSNCIRI